MLSYSQILSCRWSLLYRNYSLSFNSKIEDNENNTNNHYYHHVLSILWDYSHFFVFFLFTGGYSWLYIGGSKR
jgi:hypothetical protein